MALLKKKLRKKLRRKLGKKVIKLLLKYGEKLVTKHGGNMLALVASAASGAAAGKATAAADK